MRYTVDNDLVD